MTPDQLRAKIWWGYGKAGSKLGATYSIYRPSLIASGVQPIGPGTLVGTTPAAFTPAWSHLKYQSYGKPDWLAMVDGNVVAVGDYLVPASGETYFIAALQRNLPPMAVDCNRTISAYRPQQQTGVGALGYGGTDGATETLLLDTWPCSILQASKRQERSEVRLPGDVAFTVWQILLPYWSKAVLRSDDILADDMNRRFIVVGAELTDLGWRLLCSERVT